jgi:aspartate carbamoyltransferase regulatory subunit
MGNERVEIIPKIENGVVIDHIPVGLGPKVLKLIRSQPDFQAVVTLGMNFASTRLGRKDMVKLHDADLPERLLAQLSLLAPGITVKRVRDFVVEEKVVVLPPRVIVGLARCRNPNCLSNHEEGARSRFTALEVPGGVGELRETIYRCAFCERSFRVAELEILPMVQG